MANLAALLPPLLYGLACVALVGVLATLAASATEPRADRRRVALTAALAVTLIAPLPLWLPALLAATLIGTPRRRWPTAANDNFARADRFIDSWVPVEPENGARRGLRIVT